MHHVLGEEVELLDDAELFSITEAAEAQDAALICTTVLAVLSMLLQM